MMDIQDEKNYVFNIRLAKLIGLYQMLNPGTKKCRGQKVYHIVSSCYTCVLFGRYSTLVVFTCKITLN